MKNIYNCKDKEMKEVFACARCGFCCLGETTVSLDEADQKRMLGFLKIPRDEALARFWVLRDGVVQMKTKDGHCIFFDNVCTVHQGRPWRCRQWPMVPAILHDRTNLQIIYESCPGINKEASYEKVCSVVQRVNLEYNIQLKS